MGGIMTKTSSRAARLRRPALAFALLGAAAACSDVADTSQPAEESAAIALHRREQTIRGVDFTRYRLAGHPTQLKAVDLSTTTIEAQVEGRDGFEVFPGAG